jgi:segregation and condensation protein A
MSETLVLSFEPEDAGNEAFTVDIDGFEGPLDLLLHLARHQKVDLATISILKLAEQYLLFVDAARKHRLELAADYLVMAAWLAYLKSRLLLPRPGKGDELPAEEMAEQLARRLRRLASIRDAAEKLMTRPRLGHTVFARGMPEPLKLTRMVAYDATLYDLLAAYGAQRMLRAP